MDVDQRLAAVRREISELTPMIQKERELADKVWCRDCVPRYTQTYCGRCMLITWLVSILTVVSVILLLALTDLWSHKNIPAGVYIIIAPIAAIMASLFTMFCDRGAQSELEDLRYARDNALPA